MSNKKDTLISFEEFVELWSNLAPEQQTALEEFIYAGQECSVEQAIDHITNEKIREDFKQVLRAEGQIA